MKPWNRTSLCFQTIAHLCRSEAQRSRFTGHCGDLTPQLLDMNYIIHQGNEDIQKNNDVVEKLEDFQISALRSLGLSRITVQGEIDTYNTAQKRKDCAERI